MEDLHDVTLQYLSCADPTEAKARQCRVLEGDAQGQMEEVAAGILAANTFAPLAPDTSLGAETVDQRITSPLLSNGFKPSEEPPANQNEDKMEQREVSDSDGHFLDQQILVQTDPTQNQVGYPKYMKFFVCMHLSNSTSTRGYKGTNIKSKLLPAYRSRIGLFQAISCLPTLDMFACENLSSNILKRIVTSQTLHYKLARTLLDQVLRSIPTPTKSREETIGQMSNLFLDY
ncbi:hypothetical protein YC2023_122832 [Brassica napus]